MRMRRIGVFLITFTLLSVLHASTWSAGGSLGVRYRSTAPDLISYGVFSAFDDFSFYVSAIGNDDYAVSLRYDLPVGKTIHNEFIFHTDIASYEGGYSTLGYLFSQRFRWSWFMLGYGVGVQGGVSFSPYSAPFYSLIPLFQLNAGAAFGPVSILLYGTNATHDAIEWKMMVSLGTAIRVNIDEHNSLFIDGFITLDNLMDMSDYTLSGYGVKIGYSYRGLL